MARPLRGIPAPVARGKPFGGVCRQQKRVHPQGENVAANGRLIRPPDALRLARCALVTAQFLPWICIVD